MIPRNLQNHYDLICEFFEKEGFFKARKSKITRINANLFIFGSLTQSQLQTLTKYSQSTLSRILGNLVNAKIYDKFSIPPNKANFYKFNSRRNKLGLQGYTDFELRAVNEMQGLLKLLKRLEKEPNATYGQKIFKNQCIETLFQFGLHFHQYALLENIPFSSIPSFDKYLPFLNTWKNPDNEFLKASKLIEPHFNEKLLDCEKKYMEAAYGQSYKSLIKHNHLFINAYCTTRKIISQPTLHKLTGLSIPLISKVMNFHTELGQVTKIDPRKSKTGRILYYSPALPVIQVNYELKLLTELMKLKKQFESSLLELNNLKIEERNEGIFTSIFHAIQTLFLEIFPRYEKRYKQAVYLKQRFELSDQVQFSNLMSHLSDNFKQI
ncbi:hypothetical protein NEF87_000531 [Candidatus Lokiarchaeum ossiferum]|uniref:MarR family transcriptional regulator n=1 Tax=Candidatus Lokiarchaeum ossiferum TaxID=2951803 RepID=A0ABY6HL60_9ARCH|nr:hypothetical protein NEF87_000531 [Candidatus Lokiarchaeum sp. B-35]